MNERGRSIGGMAVTGAVRSATNILRQHHVVQRDSTCTGLELNQFLHFEGPALLYVGNRVTLS